MNWTGTDIDTRGSMARACDPTGVIAVKNAHVLTLVSRQTLRVIVGACFVMEQ